MTALQSGAQQLANGMAEFDQNGIQKLTKAVNGNLSGVFDRLNAVKDYANSAEVYGGVLDGQTASVKFIYKTDEASSDSSKSAKSSSGSK